MVLHSGLERYRGIATLGAGGMASVVLAEDTILGRQVALKRMHPQVADRSGRMRLRREALVGASISHPNLVSIYDVIDSDDGSAVIVMEYVQGETLRDALAREGRLAPLEVLWVLGGVAAGMNRTRIYSGNWTRPSGTTYPAPPAEQVSVAGVAAGSRLKRPPVAGLTPRAEQDSRTRLFSERPCSSGNGRSRRTLTLGFTRKHTSARVCSLIGIEYAST
jgi:hypothetical protein